MEELKVAERRYRNLLKKSLPHIDIDKTDVFQKLGFTFVKRTSDKPAATSLKLGMLNQATQNLKRKFMHNSSGYLHKLPKVLKKSVNLSDTFHQQQKENSMMRSLFEKILQERMSIREREKMGKMAQKSSTKYLEELFSKK